MKNRKSCGEIDMWSGTSGWKEYWRSDKNAGLEGNFR